MSVGISTKAAQLREVAEQLGPAQTLVRIGERARFTVTAVSLVGTALSAVGLISADRLLQPVPAKILAYGAALLSMAAVTVALWYLALRVTWINRRNLYEVEDWLTSELRRVRLVVWSGRLLVAGVLAAVAATVLSVALAAPQPTLVVQLLQNIEKADASVRLRIDGGDPGAHYQVILTRTGAPQGTPALLVAELVADRAGAVSLDATVKELRGTRSVTAETWYGNLVLASAVADLGSRR